MPQNMNAIGGTNIFTGALQGHLYHLLRDPGRLARFGIGRPRVRKVEARELGVQFGVLTREMNVAR